MITYCNKATLPPLCFLSTATSRGVSNGLLRLVAGQQQSGGRSSYLSVLLLSKQQQQQQQHKQQNRRYLSSSSSSSIPKYLHYEVRQTRWNDNDGFGHVNNSVYYQYMDDSINIHLISRDIGRNYPRFIAENGVQFYTPISFPTAIKVGLRVMKLGTSSVTYDIGFFPHQQEEEGDNDNDNNDGNEERLAARGKFVHVYIDESTGRPIPIPDKARKVLQTLTIDVNVSDE